MSAYRPDHLFHAEIDVRESYPNKSHVSRARLTGRTTYKGVGKRSHARLSLLGDIDSPTGGFCTILSRDLAAHERSLSFTYGRPAESWSSLGQMYFGKRRASRKKFVLEPFNFADDIV